METIKAHFVFYIKQNEHSTGEANGKSYNIDKGINFVIPEIAKRNFDIVSDHSAVKCLLGPNAYAK
jgi:predicted nucleotide-binding protein (sugar kinase/HSP70/actin superfamily)